MFKKILFTFIFFIIFLVVFFSIGEVCFRLSKGKPEPLYDITQKSSQYLFKPSLALHQLSSVAGEYDYYAHMNQLGYRGKDFVLTKNSGVTRILAIGDSFTFGVGARDDETIPVVLENLLKAKGFPVEVINAGIGHTSPITHYVNLRDMHLKLKPDVVVLLLDMTDIWDDWHTERNAIYKNGDIERFDITYIDGKKNYWIVAMNHSAFCRWIDRKIVRTFKKAQTLGVKKYFMLVLQGKRAKGEISNSKSVEEDKKMEYDGLLFMRGASEKDLIEKQWARTALYLSKIHALCARENIPLVLVMYPHGIYVGPTQWHEGRLPWGFEQNKTYTDYLPFEIVGDYAKKENVPFINTLDNFLKAPADKRYFFDWDGHMTPDGYHLVAEGIADSSDFLNILNEIKNKN